MSHLSSHPTDQSSTAFRCEGLSKRYPGVVALDNLSFEAVPGKVHALLGENGAGKSTFVKALAGVVRPDSGAMTLAGEQLELDTPPAARECGVGVCFQELSVIPALTVAENIWMENTPRNLLGMVNQRALRRRTLELLDRLEAPFVEPDALVGGLSISDRQLVEILGCLARDPRVLVFDEATAALPEGGQLWAAKVARRAAEAGAVVFFISHRLREVRAVADRLTVLRGGRLVLTGDPATLTDDEIIVAMLGRKPERLFPPSSSAPTDEVLLSVRGLSVDDRIRDVSFDVRRGEIVGLGGLQGQGQSAVLSALFGMVPSKGRVELRGKTVHLRNPHKALDLGIALVPEDRRYEGLLLDKPIRENISLPVLGRITRGGLLSARADTEMALAGVRQLQITAASVEDPPTTLSGGNQQKVVLAKLLGVGGDVLLLHDVTRGIDVGTKAEIFALLRELAASGKAIVMYSSDNQELVNMCDRLIVMRAGGVAASLDGERISEEEIMRAALDVAADREPQEVKAP